MNDSNKKISLLAAFVFFAAAVLAVYFFYVKEKSGNENQDLANAPSGSSPVAQASVSSNEAILAIVFDDGKERWFAGEVKEGTSALDVLVAASLAGNFSFAGSSQIQSLGGVKNTKASKWGCEINSSKIENLSQKLISPGEKVTCRYSAQ